MSLETVFVYLFKEIGVYIFLIPNLYNMKFCKYFFKENFLKFEKIEKKHLFK